MLFYLNRNVLSLISLNSHTSSYLVMHEVALISPLNILFFCPSAFIIFTNISFFGFIGFTSYISLFFNTLYYTLLFCW